jgi:glycosyltransferase involved in cell wall biosynthesis
VVTIHDLSFERHPELMSRRDRFVFRTMVPRSVRRAARVLAVSESTKRDLIEHYRVSEQRIVVTPNGVDSLFRPEGDRRDGAPYALFVGTLQPRKDPIAALEALALVGGDLRLILVGPDKGSGDEARRITSKLGLNGRVEFAGHVEQQELAELYRGAACLVFPSRYEGFGLPVVEAMASGTPVVATAAGSIPEIAGDAAVLVEPGDSVALAGGIERALADRERLVRAGLERARLYSWAETARRTLAVYRQLL